MNQKNSQFLGIAIAIIVILGLMIWMLAYEGSIANVTPGEALIKGNMTDAQEESLKETHGLINQLMNWSIATIGATAFFLKIHVENKSPIKSSEIFISFFIIIVSIISVFFGHLAIDRSMDILAVKQFPPYKDVFREVARKQYVFFLFSTGLFGLHVFTFFWIRRDGSN